MLIYNIGLHINGYAIGWADGETGSRSEGADPITLELIDIPQYTGEPYVVLNDNIPVFTDGQITTDNFEIYSELDEFGRCGVAFANICPDFMPTEERGEIGQIKPSGWHTVKYSEIIEDNYLYNRCHLIAYQLAGENANEKNLITGTRYMNVAGMQPFENQVAEYVRRTSNHVLYRVTPIYDGDNLVAKGVHMEAYSVEDEGDGLCFNVFVFNVQPGIEIDYATGESRLSDDGAANGAINGEVADTEITTEVETTDEVCFATEAERGILAEDEYNYVLNTNTRKFHLPDCPSVNDMKQKNRKNFSGNRDDVIDNGYEPCKRCNP